MKRYVSLSKIALVFGLSSIALVFCLLAAGCGKAKPAPAQLPAAPAKLTITVTLHPNNADLIVDISGPEGHYFQLLYAVESIISGTTFMSQSLDLDAFAKTVPVDQSINPGVCAENQQLAADGKYGKCRIILPLDPFLLAEKICFQAISFSCRMDRLDPTDPDCNFQKSNAMCWSP